MIQLIKLKILPNSIILASYSIVIIIQLACLIVNMENYKEKRQENAKIMIFILSLIVLTLIQIFAMMENIYYISKKKPMTDISSLLLKQPVVFTIVLLILIFIISIFLIIKSLKMYKNEITSQSIREAFDNFPSAISIVNEKGLPVLVNRRMYDIIEQITGRDFQKIDDLKNAITDDNENIEILEKISKDDISIKLKDKSIWNLKEYEIEVYGEKYNQTIISNITQIYNLSDELKRKNNYLIKQKGRLEDLLEDIVNMKKEEEILSQKMYMHAELDKTVLATQLYILNKIENAPIELWQDLIKKLEELPKEKEEKTSLEKLKNTSTKLGCKVNIIGSLPNDDEVSYLVLTAIKESVINAVNHAKANEVTATINTLEQEIQVYIQDNSKMDIQNIKEGVGLEDLRQKIENINGKLEIILDKGVNLKIILPKEI